MSTQQGPLYSSLHKSSQEIRLVALLPTASDDVVRCRLIKTDLPSAVSSSYDALSYRWGSSLPKRDIVLDGRQVLVRFNLRDALKKLEYAQTERLLWVDAICINQDDISERNHQVAMMGQIYSRAARVHVWLGGETRLSKVAFDFLKLLDRDTQVAGDLFGGRLVQSSITEGVRAFRSLCDMMYWTRVWIVQEIVLAKRITIHCGEDSIDWRIFSDVRHRLANMPQHRPGLYQGSLDQLDFSSTIAAKIDILRVRRNTDPNGCELIALLEACEHSSSHDPRDRLYGILGLASDVSEQDFVIDYAITLRKLHEDLIRFYRRRFPMDEIKLVRFSQFIQRILGGQCDFDSEQQDLSSTTVNVGISQFLPQSYLSRYFVARSF